MKRIFVGLFFSSIIGGIVHYFHLNLWVAKALGTASQHILVITLVLCGVGGLLGTLLWPKVEHLWRKIANKPALAVSFSDHVNFNRLENSAYAVVINIGVENAALDSCISQYSYHFRITNKLEKTIEDIQAHLKRIIYKNGMHFDYDIPLPRIPNNSENSIHPSNSANFQLIQFLDEKSAGGLVHTHFVSTEEFGNYQFLAARKQILTANHNQVLAIPFLGGIGIQKPITEADLVHVEIAIYAKDLRPIFARFSIAAPDKINVRLLEQGYNLSSLA